MNLILRNNSTNAITLSRFSHVSMVRVNSPAKCVFGRRARTGGGGAVRAEDERADVSVSGLASRGRTRRGAEGSCCEGVDRPWPVSRWLRGTRRLKDAAPVASIDFYCIGTILL